MTEKIQVNGAAGKLIASALLVLVFAGGVAVTFTWKVFDSLLDIRGQAVMIENLTKELPEMERRMTALIEASMQDRCFGATCRSLDDRITTLEGLHPRAEIRK